MSDRPDFTRDVFLSRYAAAGVRKVRMHPQELGCIVVRKAAFGSWVLLQPERINSYAQAVIRTVQGAGGRSRARLPD